MRAVDISHKTRGILNFTIHTDPFPSPRRFQGDSTAGPVLAAVYSLISPYALHVTGARDRRETASLLKRNNSRREYRPGFPGERFRPVEMVTPCPGCKSALPGLRLPSGVVFAGKFLPRWKNRRGTNSVVRFS